MKKLDEVSEITSEPNHYRLISLRGLQIWQLLLANIPNPISELSDEVIKFPSFVGEQKAVALLSQ